MDFEWPLICYRCGGVLRKNRAKWLGNFSGPSTPVEYEERVCSRCGESSSSIDELGRAEREGSLRYAEESVVFSGPDARYFRRAFGIGRAEANGVFGTYGGRVFSDWEGEAEYPIVLRKKLVREICERIERKK